MVLNGLCPVIFARAGFEDTGSSIAAYVKLLLAFIVHSANYPIRALVLGHATALFAYFHGNAHAQTYASGRQRGGGHLGNGNEAIKLCEFNLLKTAHAH